MDKSDICFKMNPMKFLLITLFSVFSLGVFAQTESNESEHRLIIQFVNDDPQSQKGLMKNLSNLTSGWPELQIEVVCHGPGIFILHNEKSIYSDQIRNFIEMGVVFAACENTMKGKKIDNAEIMEEATRVPMGIKEIVLKQEAGWSYVKAGI
jgi:intracellular sulfur oxidation DsrE/DsrF family protein